MTHTRYKPRLLIQVAIIGILPSIFIGFRGLKLRLLIEVVLFI